MARLASQAKAGFFPTPESVCRILSKMLEIKENARLLDPCCGEGKTLSALAEGSDATTYGIELDRDRAIAAGDRLFHTIWSDALLEARVSPAAFGLLYLNPPYDYELAPDSKAERQEARFLKRYNGVLQKDGWLILVIPYRSLGCCATTLARYFDQVRVEAFPEEEFASFKQCVVLGRKRSLVEKDQALAMERTLRALADKEPDQFLETTPTLSVVNSRMVIPSAKSPSVTFRSTRIDPQEVISLARGQGLVDEVLGELLPKRCHTIRPLAPLENGHLALLLAGGYMNGEIELQGKRLVIKGLVSKTETVQSLRENSRGETTVITRDRYQPSVKAIDMARAEVVTIR